MTHSDLSSRASRLHLAAIDVLEGSARNQDSEETAAELRASITSLRNDRDLSGASLPQVVASAVGYIDQTVYANEDSDKSVTWSNAEVLELLADIRRLIVPTISQADLDGLIAEEQRRLGCQQSDRSCWKHGGFWNGACHRATENVKKRLETR